MATGRRQWMTYQHEPNVGIMWLGFKKKKSSQAQWFTPVILDHISNKPITKIK
jgi:hypothetical protein